VMIFTRDFLDKKYAQEDHIYLPRRHSTEAVAAVVNPRIRKRHMVLDALGDGWKPISRRQPRSSHNDTC
jgi:hypothetical protein